MGFPEAEVNFIVDGLNSIFLRGFSFTILSKLFLVMTLNAAPVSSSQSILVCPCLMTKVADSGVS